VKILFLETLTASKLGASLGDAGHRLTLVTDQKAALAALTSDAFQAVIISVRNGNEAATAVLNEVRKNASLAHLYVIALVQECGEDYLLRVHEAGADASLRYPCARAVLLAQLKSAQRFVKPLQEESVDGKSAAAATTPLEQINQSKTWRTAQANLQSTASKFLTLEVAPAEIGTVTEPIAYACTIGLSNVQHQLEMRIALGADAASGKHLAVHLFGPEGTDLIPDMLGELANNMMGTLKTSLSGESLAFTAGLPQPIETHEVLRPSVIYAHQIAFALRMADAAVLIHVSIRSKANLFVRPGGLREGMILAKDLFNARGLLILHGGTRLSLNMIEKIGGILPDKLQVEVVTP